MKIMESLIVDVLFAENDLYSTQLYNVKLYNIWLYVLIISRTYVFIMFLSYHVSIQDMFKFIYLFI